VLFDRLPVRVVIPGYVQRSARDRVRFSQSPNGGGKDSPAWDFQWFVENYKVNQRHRFTMRMIYVPFESPEQIRKLAEAQAKILDRQP